MLACSTSQPCLRKSCTLARSSSTSTRSWPFLFQVNVVCLPVSGSCQSWNATSQRGQYAHSTSGLSGRAYQPHVYTSWLPSSGQALLRSDAMRVLTSFPEGDAGGVLGLIWNDSCPAIDRLPSTLLHADQRGDNGPIWKRPCNRLPPRLRQEWEGCRKRHP